MTAPSSIASTLSALLAKATPGPLEIMGDGRQAYEAKGGMVADFACQLHDDDDEEGLEKDEARAIANVKAFVFLRNNAELLLAALRVANIADPVERTGLGYMPWICKWCGEGGAYIDSLPHGSACRWAAFKKLRKERADAE